MIVVSIDLVSAISSSRNRSLGTLRISNDGVPQTERLHSYNVEVISRTGIVTRRGRVEGWDRERKSPMQLLTAALKAAGYK